MNINKDKQIGPVCRFGPGGDFVSAWPPETSEHIQPSSNRLSRLVSSIPEILTAVLGSEFNPDSAPPTNIRCSTNRIFCRKEKLEYAVKNNQLDKPAHATPTTIIKSNRRFSDEPMLFANDYRIGVRTEHKQKHRIRAHRKTAKKRSALSMSWQGSLFETNFKSARTA